MASLVNSLHVQTPKAEETPLATPLPPNPSAGRAAHGWRGCLGNCRAAGAVRLFWKLLWPLGFTWRPLPSAPCFSAPLQHVCPGREGRKKGRSHPGVKEGQRTGELKEWPPPEVKSRVSRRPEKGQKVAGETGRRRVNEPASLAPGNSLTGAKLPWRTRLTVTPVPTGLSLPHPAILEFALNMLLDLI